MYYECGALPAELRRPDRSEALRCAGKIRRMGSQSNRALLRANSGFVGLNRRGDKVTATVGLQARRDRFVDAFEKLPIAFRSRPKKARAAQRF